MPLAFPRFFLLFSSGRANETDRHLFFFLFRGALSPGILLGSVFHDQDPTGPRVEPIHSHLSFFHAPHLQKNGSEHEAGTQRDEIPQRSPGPFMRRDDHAAENVGGRGRKREDNGIGERRHAYPL